MNQQYMFSEVSFNRKTHKTRLCIGQLMKMWWPEAPGNPALYFPGSDDVQKWLIQ